MAWRGAGMRAAKPGTVKIIQRGDAVHGLLADDRAAIIAPFDAWGEIDRSHRKPAHRGSCERLVWVSPTTVRRVLAANGLLVTFPRPATPGRAAKCKIQVGLRYPSTPFGRDALRAPRLRGLFPRVGSARPGTAAADRTRTANTDAVVAHLAAVGSLRSNSISSCLALGHLAEIRHEDDRPPRQSRTIRRVPLKRPEPTIPAHYHYNGGLPMARNPTYPSGVPPDVLRAVARSRGMTPVPIPVHSSPGIHRLTKTLAQTRSPVASSPDVARLTETIAKFRSLHEVAKVAQPPVLSVAVQRALESASQPFATRSVIEAAQNVPPSGFLSLQRSVAQMLSPGSVAKTLAQPYNQQTLGLLQANIHTSLSTLVQHSAAGAWARAAEAFEAELEASGDLPTDGGGVQFSMGWWLINRPLGVQLALLTAAVQALDKGTRLLEELSGRDIPDSLQATTEVLLAVAVFLALYLQERDKSS